MDYHWLIIVLSVLGFVTGFIGTTTGGSVLVTVPAMIALGINPKVAIASARISSLGTMLGGLRQYHKKGMVDYPIAILVSIPGILGAFAGAYFMVKLPESMLAKSIGALTLILLILTLLKRKSKNAVISTHKASKKRMAFGMFCFFFVGALGGFYGCQAILATYVFTLVFNKTMSQSVGTRKVSGLVISLSALIIYGVSGAINLTYGVPLFIGTLIGSTFGAQYALKKGDRWIEMVFIVIVVLLSINMII